MSATISEASDSASEATACRLMVQLPPLLELGMLTMSNGTLRQSGWRSRAEATRFLISSRVAGVFAKNFSNSMSIPSNRGFGRRVSDERAGQYCWGAFG